MVGADGWTGRWAEALGVPLEEDSDTPHFMLVADPAFAATQDALAGLDFAYPTSTKVDPPPPPPPTTASCIPAHS